MAYPENADYQNEPTDELRLAKARRFLSEINAVLAQPDVSADGKSVNKAVLAQLHKAVTDDVNKWETQGVGAVNGGVMLAKRRR